MSNPSSATTSTALPSPQAASSLDVRAQPLVPLLPYQKAAVVNPARFTWNCWSRQTGKSFTFSLRRLIRGLLRRRNQIILSAGERQSREVMEKVRMHCMALKIWSEVSGDGFFHNTSFKKLEVRLPGNVRIIALPANPMTARGFTGDVFLDEFAMHRDDDAIWASLFPTVLRGEGELDIASTPRGRKNFFYKLQDNSCFSQTTVTLEAAVRQGLEVDPIAVRAGIGDELAWRQEFCCEFADEATSFMTYELIRACGDPAISMEVDWNVLSRKSSELYVGVDVGRYRDLTAIWLWERSGNALVTRGVIVLENAPFAEQEKTLIRILEHPAVRRACLDATGLGLHLAERMIDRFGDHRIESVVFTAALKSELAGALRVAAEQHRLRIPVDEGIARDWHSITRTVTTAGHVRYEGDRSGGGHADRFWAAALGIHAAGSYQGGGEQGYVATNRLRFVRDGVW